ncbi:MAG: OmpA family protein [Christiangramia sp.]|nr:hypothetical protein [Christiangramia sp.]
MKKISILALLAAMLLSSFSAEAQILKKLKKSAERAAERTILNRTDREVSKKTDAAIDSVLKKNESKNANTSSQKNPETLESPAESSSSLYQNFDFVPGDKILVFDNFSADNPGDFPAKWDTNGSGEVVNLSNSNDKWLMLANKSSYLPHTQKLPAEYTIEFDLQARGLTTKTSSQAMLELWFDAENGYRKAATSSSVMIPFCLFIDPGIQVRKISNGQQEIYNEIENDIRDVIQNQFHVSVAVNKTRLRVWLNEEKTVDVPRLLNEGKASYFKLYPRGFNDNSEQLLITNFKIAEGGVDLRNKLLTEGSFSTTGILFDSGSDVIKPESYGVLKTIAEALGDGELNIQIIGHTDSDGETAFNQQLSEKRAASVKSKLVQDFGISAQRITTSGKGESAPVASNDDDAGKAQNRRVEFVKI